MWKAVSEIPTTFLVGSTENCVCRNLYMMWLPALKGKAWFRKVPQRHLSVLSFNFKQCFLFWCLMFIYFAREFCTVRRLPDKYVPKEKMCPHTVLRNNKNESASGCLGATCMMPLPRCREHRMNPISWNHYILVFGSQSPPALCSWWLWPAYDS